MLLRLFLALNSNGLANGHRPRKIEFGFETDRKKKPAVGREHKVLLQALRVPELSSLSGHEWFFTSEFSLLGVFIS